jgi:hypothetical protein
MTRIAVSVAVAASAAAVLTSCSGGGNQTGTTPGTPTAGASSAPVLTPPPVSSHDLAVALRQVLTQGGAELAATSSDLQHSATLDQAAQTLGSHGSTFDSLHTTLDQLPSFPVPQTQQDVRKLDTDMTKLSTVISAALAAEVSQYQDFKRQITAAIVSVNGDIGVVTNELKGY